MGEPAENIEARAVSIVPPQKAELVSGHKVAPIVPRTVDEVARVANAVIFAGLAPKSYEGKDAEETRSKIMIGIMKGAEVGLPPITALSTIAIINNRPCIWGDGAMALVMASGHVEKVESFFEGEDGKDDYTAVYRIWRKGHAQAYEGRFSIGDAKRAKLWGNPSKQPWILYPGRMQFNRARAFAVRDGFADCLAGLSITEEVQDIPAPPPPVKANFLDDAQPPVELPEATGEPAQKPMANAGMLEDITPSDWEVIAEDLARQYNDTFPSDRHDFLTDHADQLNNMWKADPEAHRLFMTKTGQV